MYWLNMKRIVHCFCSDSNYWDQFHTQRIPQKLCSSGNLRHERSPNNGFIAISSPFSNHLPKKAKFQCCYNWRNKVLPTLVIPLFLFPTGFDCFYESQSPKILRKSNKSHSTIYFCLSSVPNFSEPIQCAGILLRDSANQSVPLISGLL